MQSRSCVPPLLRSCRENEVPGRSQQHRPPTDGLVVYAFTTTNIDHFAAARVPEETIVRLNLGDYPFVTAPTVIDLTWPEVEQLSAIVSAQSFKFSVQLRSEHIKRIDDAVRASTGPGSWGRIWKINLTLSELDQGMRPLITAEPG